MQTVLIELLLFFAFPDICSLLTQRVRIAKLSLVVHDCIRFTVLKSPLQILCESY
jgi:hypothetical protein